MCITDIEAHAAVHKMAVLDRVNLAHLWKDDVTVETMPVVHGSVRLPGGPGLGVTLDKGKLEQYKHTPPPQQTPFLVRVRYKGSPTIYFRHDPEKPGARDNLRFLQRALNGNVPGPVPGYGNPVVSDFWDEVDSPQFKRIWEKTESETYWMDES